jgi:hypothetical protein
MAMGLLKSGINEVIATTRFNAAPMGIHFREGNASMVLFCGSNTAENIEREGWVVANFVQDPVLYVRTAFEDLPRNLFIEEPVSTKTIMRLVGADAWAAFTATIVRKTNESMIVRLTLEKEIIEEVAVYPVNRGFNSLIEATVHATRYTANQDPVLKRLIDYHVGIVRKCGGKRELEALELLKKYMYVVA